MQQGFCLSGSCGTSVFLTLACTPEVSWIGDAIDEIQSNNSLLSQICLFGL